MTMHAATRSNEAVYHETGRAHNDAKQAQRLTSLFPGQLLPKIAKIPRNTVFSSPKHRAFPQIP